MAPPPGNPRHNRVAVIESVPGSPVTSEGKAIMTRRVRGPLDGPLLPYGPGFEAALTGQGLLGRLDRAASAADGAPKPLACGTAPGSRRSDCQMRAAVPALQASTRPQASRVDGRPGPLLDYLGSAGAAPAGEPQAAGPVDALIADYRRYLLQERGLSPQSSVPHYADVARRFVAHCGPGRRASCRA